MKYPFMVLLVLFSLSLSAQQDGHAALQELYQDVLHPTDPLLNGREYGYYFQPRVSTPLIPEEPYPPASVRIRQKLVSNVMLLYDTYKDLVVYYNPGNLSHNFPASIIVNSHIIEEFTLNLPTGQSRFRYLSFPEDQEGLLSNGFYEIVSEGTCTFIIKHSSLKKVQDGAVVYQYKPERYFISSGAAYRIKGKKSLLEALSDRAEEVNEYLKRTKIQVATADKEQLKGVLDYYTVLKQAGD
jgi:hypothetical protein